MSVNVDTGALSEQARDMLLNAEARVGGRPGIGPDDAVAELTRVRLLSPAGNLTQAGLVAHYAIGVEEGWYPESDKRGR